MAGKASHRAPGAHRHVSSGVAQKASGGERPLHASPGSSELGQRGAATGEPWAIPSPLRDVLEIAGEAISKATDSTMVGALFLDEGAGLLEVVDVRRLREPGWGRVVSLDTLAPAQQPLRSHPTTPVILEGVELDSPLGQALAACSGAWSHGPLIAMPLSLPSGAGGFMVLTRPTPPSQQEVEALQFFADLVILAVTSQGTPGLLQFCAGLLRAVLTNARLLAQAQAHLRHEMVQRLQRESRWVQEVKEAREILRFHELVAQLTGEAVVASDVEGRVTLWSHRAEALWGWAADEMLGAPLARLWSLAEGPSPADGELWDGDIPVIRRVRSSTRSGESIWVECAVTALRGDGGCPRGFLSVVRDVTAHHEAEEHLRRGERLRNLGQLASGIAHDLSNALMVTRGQADVCLGYPNLEPSLRRHLEVMRDSAANGEELVQRIRSFYQPLDSSQRCPLQLNRVIAAAAAQVEGSIPALRPALKQRVNVHLDLEVLPPMVGNERELGQVFTNLMLNALDAMPQGGTLSISSRNEGGRIGAVVRDSGMGMTEEIQRRIFEPFFTTKGSAGSGLGLSIVHDIVRRHGGAVSVESTVGRGTSFALSFPLTPLSGNPSAVATPQQSPGHPLSAGASSGSPWPGPLQP